MQKKKKCPELDADYIKFISYGRANDEPRYSANYTHRFAISVCKCHSSDLIFKNNQGTPSSGELCYSPQSGQPSCDDSIFRGILRSCSVKIVLKIFAKFTRKDLCRSLLVEKETTGAFLFFCEFSEFFKNTLFTEHLRETASVIYWRKKNMLFTLSWKEQRRYDTVMFLLEFFLQNLVLKFFGPKKTRFKTRKRHFETFYYWRRFYFTFALDKTNILGPNYTVNVLQSYANFSDFK